MKFHLECPRCKIQISWSMEDSPEGPGECICGAWAPWNVIKGQECPVCGDYHNSIYYCDVDDNYEPERDWGDL